MKSAVVLAAMSGALVSAQSTMTAPITASCPAANTAYCAGGDIIVSCDSNSNGTPLNCNDMIGNHEGGLENAQCYQPATGNAVCEVYGTVYASSTTYAITTTPTPAPSVSPVSCPAANTVYCAGGDIIVSCDGNSVGIPHNCNDILGNDEGGLENAQCYQPATGNAVCEVYGTAYASSTTYAIPSTTGAPPSSTSVSGPTLISGSGTLYNCPSANANYCLAADILLVCNSASTGQPENCNDVLGQYANPSAENAYCYDAQAGDGNAACAISGYAFASSTTYMVPVPTYLQSQETAYPPPSNFPFLPQSSTSPSSTPTTASTSILQGEGAIRGEHAAAGLAAVIGMLAFAL